MRGLAGGSCLRRLVLAGAVVAGTVMASGCDASSGRSADPSKKITDERAAVVLPAFEAGGACQLLDYDTIRRTTGLNFSVAAAAQQGETYTCLLQQRGASLPDLALSVSATIADEKAFQSTVMPQGASRITGLGKIAYSIPVAAAGDAGPGGQVGWLSPNRRLIALRIRLTQGTTPEDAAAFTAKLVTLAQVVDFISA